MVRAPFTLTILMVLAAVGYMVSFWVMVTMDANSAWSRFSALTDSGASGRAVGHGDRAITLLMSDGIDNLSLQRKQLDVARAHDIAGDPNRSIELYALVLDSPLGSQMTEPEQFMIKNRMAVLSLQENRPVDAAILMSEFIDAAGDDAAQLHADDPGSDSAAYLDYVNAAIDGFTNALPPITDREFITGEERDRLIAASRMTSLGGYYARRESAEYAAAGLLAAAYRTRMEILGADHEDTSQTALLLAPVYEAIGRISDAERLYLETFHAQERLRGSNSPELSLYIRLLSDIYRRQGRITEAEALNVHMRNIFRDAFGARRYAPNQDRDRSADINRPVSRDFPLSSDYAPQDLVEAELFSVPLSKEPTAEEMSIRAALLDVDTSMPKLLADLIGECQSDAERLSLRSGYRSYDTQVYLYENHNHNGQITAPGTSEHQLGLAADIDVNGRFMRSTDRAFQCFEAQAWRYGFILSYPRGNTYLEGPDTFEPWHWRFVGPQTALLYRETGPIGFPQEFLAALPCYEERALSGLFISASEGQDVCLATVTSSDTQGLGGN